MSDVSRGYTFSNTEVVTAAKLHALVDDASVSGIVNADVDSGAAIDSSKIAFSLTDYVTIAGTQTVTGAKTFSATTMFSTPLADSNLAQVTTASKVHGTSLTGLASIPAGAGVIPSTSIAPTFMGSFSKNIADANGTQSITGVGFTPRMVILFGSVGVAGTASIGAMTSLSKGTMYLHGSDGTWNTLTSVAARFHSSSGNYNDATLSTFDADGFTLNWTKTGSPTGTTTINYIAFP